MLFLRCCKRLLTHKMGVIVNAFSRNTNNTKFKAQGSNVILTVKIKEDAYDYPTVDEWETYFKTINGNHT